MELEKFGSFFHFFNLNFIWLFGLLISWLFLERKYLRLFEKETENGNIRESSTIELVLIVFLLTSNYEGLNLGAPG